MQFIELTKHRILNYKVFIADEKQDEFKHSSSKQKKLIQFDQTFVKTSNIAKTSITFKLSLSLY
ncbi:hypothetical protein DWW52_18400 [Odoribacter sp. AF15-53]|nr:hypothetical protein DWW52_18400 [Odoribacter sp. AF15-53]